MINIILSLILFAIYLYSLLRIDYLEIENYRLKSRIEFEKDYHKFDVENAILTERYRTSCKEFIKNAEEFSESVKKL